MAKLQLIAVKMEGKTVESFKLADITSPIRTENGLLDKTQTLRAEWFDVTAVTDMLLNNRATIVGIQSNGLFLEGSNGSFNRYANLKVIEQGKKYPLTVFERVNISGVDGATVLDVDGRILTVSMDKLVKYAEAVGVSNGKVVEHNGVKFISSIRGEYNRVGVKPNYETNIGPVETEGDVQLINKLKRGGTGMPGYWPEGAKLRDEKLNLTAEEKLIVCYKAVQNWNFFIYSILSQLTLVPLRPEVMPMPTMGVNIDMTMIYNPEFVIELPLEQLIFVLLHETYHVLFSHPARIAEMKLAAKQRGTKTGLPIKEEMFMYNIAADLFVNKYVANQFNCSCQRLTDIPHKVITEDPFVTNTSLKKWARGVKNIQMRPGFVMNDRVDCEKDSIETLFKDLLEEKRRELEQQRQQERERQQSQQSSDDSDDFDDDDGAMSGFDDSDDMSSQGGQQEDESDAGDSDDNQGDNSGQDSDEDTNGNEQEDFELDWSADGDEEEDESENMSGSGNSSSNNDDYDDTDTDYDEQSGSGNEGDNENDDYGEQERTSGGNSDFEDGDEDQHDGDSSENDELSGSGSGTSRSGEEQEDEDGTNESNNSSQAGSRGRQSETEGDEEDSDGDSYEDSIADGYSRLTPREMNERRESIASKLKEYEENAKKNGTDLDIMEDNNPENSTERIEMTPEEYQQQIEALKNWKDKLKSTVLKAEVASQQRGLSLSEAERRLVDSIIKPVPINWKVLLKRMFNMAAQKRNSFKRPSRRPEIGKNVILPGKTRKDPDGLEKIIFAIDTSTSVGDRELRYVLGTIRALTDKYKVDVEIMWWSTRVNGVEPIKSTNDLLRAYNNVASDGGTCATNMFKYIKNPAGPYRGRQIHGLIIYTDGYIEDVELKYKQVAKNILWMIHSRAENTFTAPFGTTCYVNVDNE